MSNVTSSSKQPRLHDSTLKMIFYEYPCSLASSIAPSWYNANYSHYLLSSCTFNLPFLIGFTPLDTNKRPFLTLGSSSFHPVFYFFTTLQQQASGMVACPLLLGLLVILTSDPIAPLKPLSRLPMTS